MDTIDLLLVGKTGNGKSALGNSILRRKAFKSMNSTQSVTKTVEFDFSEFEKRIIKVVDGPGVGDTDLDPQEAAKLVVDAMSKAICFNTKGFHAILVVVRYGGRFTKEDVDTLEILKTIFGEKFISEHAILVMTGGDNFKKDAAESKQTFEKWCTEQTGVFKQLFTGVQNRAVMFDNKTKDDNMIYEQLRRLLTEVDSLGARYTSETFEEARQTRDRYLQDEKLMTLDEDVIQEIGVITQLLGHVDVNNPTEGLRQLEKLMRRTDILLQNIKKKDKGTNSAAWKMAQMLKVTNTELTEDMNSIVEGMQADEPGDNVMLQEDSQRQSEEQGLNAEDKDMATSGVKLQRLRLEKEMMEDERQEAERRDWQKTLEERKSEAEKRAQQREQGGDQMTNKELRKEKKTLQNQHKAVMTDLKKVLQEKIPVLEEEYHEVKKEAGSNWLKAAPSVFPKLWAKISKIWKSK